MDLSKLHEFSKSFGPPKTDLRLARISDDWGDDRCAKMPIFHKLPEDVTIEELNYYPQGWFFKDIDSLLFYAYAVFKHHDDPAGNDYWRCGVDGFFCALENEIDVLVKKESVDILFDSIKIMWNENPYFFDLEDCPKLRKILKIKIKSRDL